MSDVLQGKKLGSVLNLSQSFRCIGALVAYFGERRRNGLSVLLEYKRGMIAKFPEILQRLEDVLLAGGRFCFCARRLDCGRRGAVGVRLCELVIQILLHIRELAIVILDDLWREIIENILLQPAE